MTSFGLSLLSVRLVIIKLLMPILMPLKEQFIDRTEIQRRLGLAKAYNASISGTSSQSTQSVLRDSYSEEQKRQGGLNTLGC